MRIPRASTVVVGTIIITILAGVIFNVSASDESGMPDADQLGPNGHYPFMRVDERGVPYLIPLEHVTWGGVARDGIPAIDRPHFVREDRWPHMGYHDDRFVVGVEVNGKYRAYPLQVLVFHEIINDTFEGIPLAVTY